MQRIVGIGAAALVLLGATAAFADGTASNTAYATAGGGGTIVKPVTLSKNTDLEFGRFTIDAAASGTVSVDANSTPSALGGVVLVGGITPSAAKFTVNGEANQAFTLVVPGSATVTFNLTTLNIALNNDGPAVLSGVNQTFRVWGTMTVPAGSPAGRYTNSSAIPVTVTYN